jgi:hypothetical protein
VSEPERWPVTLVLDTSAVLAFAAGSMHVHEPILMADELKEDVAVPTPCLVEAIRRDPSIDVRELLHHPRIMVMMPDRAYDDLVLDWTLYYDGREDCAAAAVLAHQFGPLCSVLSAEPDTYAIAGERPDWIIAADGIW